MRFQRRRRKRADEAVIDVTSLIDAAFILIIFLLVTTSFKRKDHAFSVTLPSASEGAVVVEIEHNTVFITSDGGFHFLRADPGTTREALAAQTADNTPLSSDDLRSAAEALLAADPETTIRLVIDRKTAYQHIISAIDAVRAAGARNLQFPYEHSAPEPTEEPTP